MERIVEFTGKKVQEAVDIGLKTLGITLDDADIKILSNGGLFKKAKVAIKYDDGLKEGEVPAEAKAPEKRDDAPTVSVSARENKETVKTKAPEGEPHWGSAPVKREPTTTSDFGKACKEKKKEQSVSKKENKEDAERKEPRDEKQNKEPRRKKERESVLPTDEQVEQSKTFVSELLAKMNISGNVETVVDEGLRINVDTEDARVIGHRGEVLDAIQQLVSSVINTSHGKFVHITVDGLGYRDRRKETLENLARRMADKAARIRRKVTLDAMNSADRRIVHAALGEREDVFTRSEGHEPNRKVAIIPKRNT